MTDARKVQPPAGGCTRRRFDRFRGRIVDWLCIPRRHRAEDWSSTLDPERPYRLLLQARRKEFQMLRNLHVESLFVVVIAALALLVTRVAAQTPPVAPETMPSFSLADPGPYTVGNRN